MDDIFSTDELLDFDHHSNLPLTHRIFDDDDANADNNDAADKVYLVPYRWWKEAQCGAHTTEGVFYTAFLNDNAFDAEIILVMRKEEDFGKNANQGSEFAVLPEMMWLRTLKWHNDSSEAAKDVESLVSAEAQVRDIFPLHMRLSVSRETTSLIVKCSQKDNAIDDYRRACNIFSSKSKLICIGDLSGQTTLLLTTTGTSSSYESPGPASKEILLVLHVYGFGGTKNEKAAEQSTNMDDIFCSGSVKMNGSTEIVNSYLKPKGAGFLGLTGLHNLGNTCFMNSAIQCLAHTPELVDYFLGDYRKEINYENPLGMHGELAIAFGDLLRKLWIPGATPVAPRMFKLKVANFAPQFSGYNQHDSQEFLAFLLDGLHEDLNRVKCKPYIEAKDAEGQPDEEVAEEYWRNHLARNDSIIVDVCQGQYRSTLVCPMCKKVSVTFDPFMYLSLPLPSTTMRTMTVTVLSTDGTTLPCPVTVTVPTYGRCKDLIQALSNACSLRDNETLLMAEVYNNLILQYLDEPTDALALIRDDDRLVAYRLPKDSETVSPLLVFIHQRAGECVERSYSYGVLAPKNQIFGIPLVAKMPANFYGFDIRKQFLKLLNPFLMPNEDALSDYDDAGNTTVVDTDMEDAISHPFSDCDADSESETRDDLQSSCDFQFYLSDKQGIAGSKVKMQEPILFSRFTDRILYVLVSWSSELIEKYDTCILGSLPEVFKPQLFTRKPQESVPLYKCLEAFLKEEPLGPEDMWYCPKCKKPQQANKKLDLWRLPEIMVIHLKRFSYSRYIKNKLETFVDFPVNDLDLSNYIIQENHKVSKRYELYAISNHYGGLGGGHYTAFVHLGHGRWYEFDDDKVFPVAEDTIKTSAAYVLFYRRV